MSFISGFFNSVNGDRAYDATFLADFFGSIVGNGVYPNPSTNLQVVERSNMQTTLKTGRVWINGYYARNTADIILNHDVADGILKRIDRVVLRLDYLTRSINVAIKKGANASTPVAPTLQRDAEAYELAVADVLISNGTTTITQANITDTRLNDNLCGIVHGAIEQVDPTAIFNQYQSWLTQKQNEYESDFDNWSDAQRLAFESWRNNQESLFSTWKTTQQQDFEDWLANLQDLLDENIAANLTNRVIALESRGEVVYSGGKVKLIY